MRIGVAQRLPLDGLDATVDQRFSEAIRRLSKARVQLSDEPLELFADMSRVNERGGFAAVEAYSIHRQLIVLSPDGYDPIVRMRIERGREISSADYIGMSRERARLVAAMDARLADLDALVMPTTPIVAPRLEEVATPETFVARNALLLRNTAIANFFDLCAISLPLPGNGLPVGLMLVARNGHDRALLRIASAVERLLAA